MNANSLRGVLLVTLAYALVGASFTANSLLGAYPYAGGQALRYAAACLLLLPLLGRGGLAPLRTLTLRHWLRLGAVAGVGMVGFNLAVLAADLFLCAIRTPAPILRWFAWVLTIATIVFNAASG
ncbi:hypothetical protein ACWGQ4_03305, partial [Streptomyces sp. NPDC055721]